MIKNPLNSASMIPETYLFKLPSKIWYNHFSADELFCRLLFCPIPGVSQEKVLKFVVE